MTSAPFFSRRLRIVQPLLGFALLALVSGTVQGQPALPAARRAQAAVVSSDEAQACLAKRVVAPSEVLRSKSSTTATPEIQELARALRNDPNLIYQYVYDRIEYTPIYGSLKGAGATLLDGKGNDFDQSSLMISLLRQAGFNANFLYGQIRVYPAQLTNWLGVKADLGAVGGLLGSVGIPAQIWSSGGSLAYVDMDHVWVTVQIGTSNYVFDPSLKTNSWQSAMNLPSAMGYSQAAFLSSVLAGATSTSSYIQNINSSALRGALGGYATNLFNYVRSNAPAATLEQVIGGKSIIPLAAFPRQTSLPYQRSVLYTWTNIPAQYKTTLRVQHLGIDVTLLSEDIYGKRLTLFYNAANQPVLRLDGSVLATGTAATLNSSQTLTLSVDHPYAANSGTYNDESQSQYLRVGGTNAYFIVNGWAGTRKAIADRHMRLLMENSLAGNASTSEPVLGEGLAALASTWLAERSRADELSDSLYRTFIIQHHVLGVCAQTRSPYIDLPMNAVSVISADGGTAAADALFFSSGGHGSAFEWGVIEQTQPGSAVSTVKLLDIANSRSNKVYDVDYDTYFGGVRSQLRNYSSAELAQVDLYANAGYRLLLPEDGDLGEGQWTGIGFLAVTPDESFVAHVINGGLKGGFGTQSGSLSPLLPPDDLFAEDHPSSPEPIDLATGDYTYTHADLALGNGPFPFSFEFRRSYNSGARFQDSPLGVGWAHNFEITAAVLSDGFQGMGANSPLAAAAAIAELYVAGDILQGTKTKERVVLATLCHRWFMDQQIRNVVSIRQPQESLQFVRLPGGVFSPPPGVAAALILKTNGAYWARLAHGEELDFDAAGRILTWRDPNTNTVTFSYAGSLLQNVTNGMGRSFAFTYDGTRISRITDSAGRTVSYSYDSAGNLTNSIDAAGQSTRFQYDAPGRLARIFYPANPTIPFVSNVYDSLGRVMTQSDARTNTYQFFFSGYRNEEVNPLGSSHALYLTPFGKPFCDIDALSNRTVSVYDGQRRLVSRTMPEGNATLYEYDAGHNLTRISLLPKPGFTNAPIVQRFLYELAFNWPTQSVDGLGRTSTMSYDGSGNLLALTAPAVEGLVPQTSFLSSRRGQLVRVTDPSGRARAFGYDAATGDLLTVTVDPGGLALLTRLESDPAGNVSRSTDPLGRVSAFAFDSLRRLQQYNAPSLLNCGFTNLYDANGNLLETRNQTGDPLSPWQTTSFAYTPTGQKKSSTSPAGGVTQYQYDFAERLSVVTDPQDHITQYRYDPIGRISQVVDALGHTNRWRQYTPNGKPASQADANGNLTLYQYDGFDRLYRTVYADGSYEQFTYDAANNVIQKRTRAGQTVSMTYDELNRMKTKSVAGTTKQFAYDLAGRLTDATDANGTIHHVYDNAGRLVSVTYPGARTLSYQYDAAGNRTALTYPDGFQVCYGYDALNRLTNVCANGTVQLARYTYDPLSRRTATTYGNGTSAAYAYQADNRLVSVANRFPDLTVTLNYAYDTAGNPTSMEVNDDRFLYKPALDSLETFVHNNLNQYTAVSGAAFSHDANGNLTSDGITSFAYDAENRLVSAMNAGLSMTNTYDPLGRRIVKRVNSSTTSYLYDGQQVVVEYSGSQVVRRYVYGVRLDEPICMMSASGSHFYHFDGLGSVLALSDTNGLVVERYRYGPFGKPAAASSLGNPYLYTGREYEPETGLYCYRARFYNPRCGRFLQVDPIGQLRGMHLYSYVENSPLANVDPLGLSKEPADNLRDVTTLFDAEMDQWARMIASYPDLTGILGVDFLILWYALYAHADSFFWGLYGDENLTYRGHSYTGVELNYYIQGMVYERYQFPASMNYELPFWWKWINNKAWNGIFGTYPQDYPSANVFYMIQLGRQEYRSRLHRTGR